MPDRTLTFLVKLDGSSGAPLWVQHFAEDEYSLSSLKVDPSGNVFFLGTLYGTFQIPGAPPITTAGCGDVLLGKIPANR